LTTALGGQRSCYATDQIVYIVSYNGDCVVVR